MLKVKGKSASTIFNTILILTVYFANRETT